MNIWDIVTEVQFNKQSSFENLNTNFQWKSAHNVHINENIY